MVSQPPAAPWNPLHTQATAHLWRERGRSPQDRGAPQPQVYPQLLCTLSPFTSSSPVFMVLPAKLSLYLRASKFAVLNDWKTLLPHVLIPSFHSNIAQRSPP